MKKQVLPLKETRSHSYLRHRVSAAIYKHLTKTLVIAAELRFAVPKRKHLSDYDSHYLEKHANDSDSQANGVGPLLVKFAKMSLFVVCFDIMPY